MFKLRVVQARHGDCLMLEYGSPSSPRVVLVDGGPATVYKKYLGPELAGIKTRGGSLDLAVVSHVDDDHIAGLLDLMKELRRQRKRSRPETIALGALWHNTFSETLGADVEDRFRSLMADAAIARGDTPGSDVTARGIGQGDELTELAGELRIPINPKFARHLVSVDEAPAPIPLDNLRLRVIGPARSNLEDLRQEWLDWLEEHERAVGTRDLVAAEQAARELDASVPNLSSIMLLAEADGKKILLTGDGLGQDIVHGLEQAGLLDAGGKLHVDILKLPHHGSQRNVTPEFFKTVTADTYVVSANGKNGNPDLETLRWLVTAAKDEGRRIDVVVTNATASTRQLVKQCPPGEYGYRLVEMKPGEPAMSLELAA